MGKYIKDSVMDTALSNAATATLLSITNDTTTPTAVTAGVNILASVAMTAGTSGGDYSLADGSSTGRKLVIAQQSDLPIVLGGTARHVVLSLGGVIMLTTTCNEQVLALNNTVTTPAFSYEIGDPT